MKMNTQITPVSVATGSKCTRFMIESVIITAKKIPRSVKPARVRSDAVRVGKYGVKSNGIASGER